MRALEAQEKLNKFIEDLKKGLSKVNK